MEENKKSKISTPIKIAIVAGIVAIITIITIVTIVIVNNSKDGLQLGKAKNEEKYSIKESETKQIKLVDYDGGNFTMKIPEGWKVTTCGTEMYYTISVEDPNDERNQIFVSLKAGPFLKTNKAKQWHTWYVNTTGNTAYNMFAEAVVLNPATTENFYQNFNTYTDYAKKYEPSYSNFTFPFLSVFTKVEEYESNSYMKSVSLDDKTIRATYEASNGKPAEGLFMATTTDAGAVYAGDVDTSFYYAYNVIFISAAKDELINYEGILTQSLSSLKYKDSFINATNSAIKDRTDAALKANATVQAAFDSYNSAWSARQKTYDITSQKYSDTTLSYERVYDTETGSIYKAYNGFTDDVKGDRFKPVTNEMYLEPITGYIEKK